MNFYAALLFLPYADRRSIWPLATGLAVRWIGVLLFALGMAFNTWIGILGVLLFIGLILVRINDKEILMREAFGQKWEAYCRQTPKLIPFVY